MELSFGARLRQQREERQIELADIAAKTKIKVALLEGLETDDLSRWPQGIFRRAYLRSYAQAIGLEPDPVLQEFLALYPDPPEDLPLVPADSPKRPPTRLRFLLSAAFGTASTRLPALDTRGLVTRERVEPVEETPIAEHDEQIEFAHTPPPFEPVDAPPTWMQPSLPTVADLCTRIGRASKITQLEPLLADVVRMLNAVGAVLWVWEPHKAALRPRVSYGYAEDVLARFPLVGRDADNAIGAAFRSGDTSVVDGTDGETGAIAVPLLGPDGCVGVLALEVRHGEERNDVLHAVASIVAAQFVSFCMPPALAEAVNA
jgi:transcriptional regulator with XRE-family HTH domain